MTTPQRVLELADDCHKCSISLPNYEPLQPEHQEQRKAAFAELEAICRHYAEIMQAEVVAVMPVFKYGGGRPDPYYAAASKAELAGMIDESYDSFDYEEADLIIKPKPLS